MIHVDPALAAADAAPAASPPDGPADAPATAAARAMVERQLQMLSRLAEIGMEIAEACGRQAAAANAGEIAGEPAPAQGADPGLAFARVSRAVRLTIALQSRLLKDLADLDRADQRAASNRKDERRRRLYNLVHQAAEAGIAARPGAERFDQDALEHAAGHLAEAAYERLTEAEDGDIFGLSFEEVVAGVCQDLRLSPEWSARVAAAVAPPAAAPDDRRPPEGRSPEGAAKSPPPLGEGDRTQWGGGGRPYVCPSGLSSAPPGPALPGNAR